MSKKNNTNKRSIKDTKFFSKTVLETNNKLLNKEVTLKEIIALNFKPTLSNKTIANNNNTHVKPKINTNPPRNKRIPFNINTTTNINTNDNNMFMFTKNKKLCNNSIKFINNFTVNTLKLKKNITNVLMFTKNNKLRKKLTFSKNAECSTVKKTLNNNMVTTNNMLIPLNLYIKQHKIKRILANNERFSNKIFSKNNKTTSWKKNFEINQSKKLNNKHNKRLFIKKTFIKRNARHTTKNKF